MSEPYRGLNAALARNSGPSEEDEEAVCECESMGGRFGAHRPECPWQVAFERQVADEAAARVEGGA